MNKIKLGLPKGSLQDATIRVFKNAGFNIYVSGRSYFPSIDDVEIEPVLLRAQEISRYVEDGHLDCGITGADWVIENNSKVVSLANMVYAKASAVKVRWVLAVPDKSKIKTVADLEGKTIATEVVNVTKKFLRKNGVKAKVEFSWGATEAKVADGLVDAVVELTETGSSLRAHNLRIITTICESTTQFVANKNSVKDEWKSQKMNQLALLLLGAIKASNMVGLKMNVAEHNYDRVVELLTSLRNPTVSPLSRQNWLALETVIDESIVRVLIPKLKEAGAEGIIEYPLNKVIY